MIGLFVHLCYKTDFLFAKSQGPQITLGILFWILNKHSVQVWEKRRCVFVLFCFFLIIYLFAFFVCNSMGNGPVEGAITSILKHLNFYYSKTYLNFFLIFAENVTLLSLNIIKLILLGPQPQSIKSPRFLHVIIWGCTHFIALLQVVGLAIFTVQHDLASCF